jgi:hypothetical protein
MGRFEGHLNLLVVDYGLVQEIFVLRENLRLDEDVLVQLTKNE